MLQRSISELYEVGDVRAFRGRLARTLPTVVPADNVVYTEIDPASGRISWSPDVESDLGLRDAAAIYTRHGSELPIVKSYRRGEGSAVKISDFLTRRQFHRTAIYNEFYRPVGAEYLIAKGLPGRQGVVTAVNILRRSRDFSERDRLLLNLLRPHLNQAYRNARALDAMHAELAALRSGVEALDQGFVVLDPNDRVVLMTTRARQWIEHYLGRVRAEGLPPSLALWIRGARHVAHADGDAPIPRTPLIVDGGGRQLVVRLMPSAGQSVLTLTERYTGPRPEALAALGLSPRENEVLAWVAEGKTNAEIALILGGSPRTIDKHLERVFRKLGVETRTAAAARALAILRT